MKIDSFFDGRNIGSVLLLILMMLWLSGLLANDKLPELHHRSNLLMPKSMLLAQNLSFETTANGKQKVVCNTCHGIENIQDKDFLDKSFQDIAKQQDDFLVDGPYEPLSDFCYLCHQRKQNQRDNIHILLDKDGH